MNAIAAMKTQILMIELLLSFALAGLLALCATYFTLAYYRLVSIAKGIAGPFEWPAGKRRRLACIDHKSISRSHNSSIELSKDL